MMRKFCVFTLVLLDLVSVIVVDGVQAQEPLAQESINVRLAVSVMQNMQIIDPIQIDKSALSGLDKEKSLIVEKAGKVRIESNVDWNLKVHTNFNAHYNVYLKIGNRWKKVTASGTSFAGKRGDQLLNLAVKIEKKEAVSSDNRKPIQLAFTLGN